MNDDVAVALVRRGDKKQKPPFGGLGPAAEATGGVLDKVGNTLGVRNPCFTLALAHGREWIYDVANVHRR